MNRFVYGFAALSTLAVATPAVAQEACAPRDEIVQKLTSDFKERQQAVGYVDDDAVLEVFVSDNGSWTIIATGTDGNSCVLSVGMDWDDSNVVRGLDTSFHPTGDGPVRLAH